TGTKLLIHLLSHSPSFVILVLTMLSLVLLLAICLILPLLIFFRKHKTTKHFPPGPKGLPIIGNLHQLDLLNISVQLADFSKIYGPIFSLKLGSRQAIVVSSSEIAKEIFKKNDHTFSDRPQLYSQQKLSYNGSEVLFSQYNESWRDIRKICVIHIFSSIRVAYYSSIRNFEVRKLIKKISENANSSSVTNMSEVLISLASSLICNIAFGKTFENEGPESSSRFPEMLHEFQALLAETLLLIIFHLRVGLIKREDCMVVLIKFTRSLISFIKRLLMNIWIQIENMEMKRLLLMFYCD
ncbi:hypothetical protein KIW84_076386, partial [Lathyrus oleraceus]